MIFGIKQKLMSTDSPYVGEGEIDHAEVMARGGANGGDEDFAVFACPSCRHVYLLEYEVDTAYLDAHDLSKRVSVFNTGFACVSCGKEIAGETAWVGPRAPARFRVLREELIHSDWRWIMRKEPESDATADVRKLWISSQHRDRS